MLKQKKSEFHANVVSFLGFVIAMEIYKWIRLKSALWLSGLQLVTARLLGFANFFTGGFSEISAP